MVLIREQLSQICFQIVRMDVLPHMDIRRGMTDRMSIFDDVLTLFQIGEGDLMSKWDLL